MSSITVSIEQIIIIAGFSGLVIDEEKSFSLEDKESFIETELTIDENQKIDYEDNTYYEGMTVHISEYPEEGYMPLEDVKDKTKTRDPIAEKFADKMSDFAKTSNYLPDHMMAYKHLVDAGVDLTPFLESKTK